MCNNFIKYLLLLLFLTTLVSCQKSSEGGAIDTPSIDIACTESKCAVAGFRDAVVVITSSGCADDQITFEDVATGSVQLVCNGSSCSGTLSQWSTNTINSNEYYLCGWIDIDNTAAKNANDVFSDDKVYVSGSPLTMTNWSVTYFSFLKRFKN